jgi:hypothetical protein
MNIAGGHPYAKHRQCQREQEGAENFLTTPANLPEPPLAAFIEVDDSPHCSLPFESHSGQHMHAARMYWEVADWIPVRSGNQFQL